MSSLMALLGLTYKDVQRYRKSPRGCCDRLNSDPLEQRTCSGDRCVEEWCPCGTFHGTGWGPAGCPCRERPPWTAAPEVSRDA